METEETVNDLLTSEIEVETTTNCESGEFYLDMAEWDSIYISSNERMSLFSDCTNVFTAKFQDLNTMCVLKFKNNWLEKPNSRKVNSPFFRARAKCKFDNCKLYTFYIDYEVNSFNNGIIVKFYSEGSLSLQHTDGTGAHSRHLSGSERSKMAGLLVNNSVSKVCNKQFTNSNSILGFPHGNLTGIKSADCLRKVNLK